MILADKIIEERKRIGWSQEELADKLDVSRQSVSKWEGAQAVPDLSRIVKMAELFNVSIDYLLKDDAVREMGTEVSVEKEEGKNKVKRVSMEEASEFILKRAKCAPLSALATLLCILSPLTLIMLGGLDDCGFIDLPESLWLSLGFIALFGLVAIGVVIFLKCDNMLKKFEYISKEEIDTLYGVDGMAKEKRNAYEKRYNRNIAIGVVLCILAVLPLIIAGCVSKNDSLMILMLGLLFVLMAIACFIFVYVSMIKNSYDMLLQEGDYTVARKKKEPIISKISSVYWLIVVAVFFILSFPKGKWDETWYIWPIAGVLYAAVIGIAKIIFKVED